jgi:hypothetical protein
MMASPQYPELLPGTSMTLTGAGTPAAEGAAKVNRCRETAR